MINILIVEDSKVVVEKLKLALFSLGYKNLLNTESGEEAIKLSKNRSIDLIIMDIILKGELDGIETSKIINKYKSIPTIFLTEDIKSYNGLPMASVYLNKPFTKNELKHNIDIILKQHFLKKNLNQKINSFSALFNCSTEGIILFNEKFIINRVNNKYKKIFNYNYEDLINNDLRSIVSSHIPFKYLKQDLLANQYFRIEQELIFDLKESKYFMIKGIPIYDKEKFKGGYLKYIDITELKRKEKEIKYISEHDSMTDLLNRRAFDNKLDEILSNKDLDVSLIIGDIDNLKEINDNYGHSTGDKIIKLAAITLKESLPSETIIARIGGDEFGIILIEKDEEKSLEYCSIINRKFKEYVVKNNIKKDISISLGFSKGTNKNKELLFNKADQEMYKKKVSRNRSN